MTAPPLPIQKLVPAIHPGKAKGGDGKRSGDGSKINNPQSSISSASASGTRIDRDSLAEQAIASSPNYPISNLQCLFLSPIRCEFHPPANRAFIG